MQIKMTPQGLKRIGKIQKESSFFKYAVFDKETSYKRIVEILNGYGWEIKGKRPVDDQEFLFPMEVFDGKYRIVLQSGGYDDFV